MGASWSQSASAVVFALALPLSAPRSQEPVRVGLWMDWNCGHDGFGIGLTILYRKAHLASIECVGG